MFIADIELDKSYHLTGATPTGALLVARVVQICLNTPDFEESTVDVEIDRGAWRDRLTVKPHMLLPIPPQDVPVPTQTYAVLLAYPDYLCDGEQETYYATAVAASVEDAVSLVRDACYAESCDAEGDSAMADPDDLRVILVHLGEARDLKFQLKE